MCMVVSPPEAPPGGGGFSDVFVFADRDLVEGAGQGPPGMALGLAFLGLGVTGGGGAQK